MEAVILGMPAIYVKLNGFGKLVRQTECLKTKEMR